MYAEGGGTATNPLTTDTRGQIVAWLEEGAYDFVVSTGGIPYTIRHEVLSAEARLALEAAHAATAGGLSAHTGSTSNPHSVTKTQVGLGSADNTADTAKPVSAAGQTALDLKQDASTAATDAELSAHTSNVANPHSVTKAQVGLGSADNTTDSAKPVSTAQQTALDAKQDASSAATDAELASEVASLNTSLGSKQDAATAATDAELAAEATVRGDADTALDTRVLLVESGGELLRNDRVFRGEDYQSIYGGIRVSAPGAICGYWDDADLYDLTAATDLAARGIPWGFAITTNFVGSAGNKLTWDQVRTIRELGHEIVAHSKTHTNPASWAQFVDETEGCRDLIAAENLYCDSFKEPGPFAGAYKIDLDAERDSDIMRQYRKLFAHQSGYDISDHMNYTRPLPVLHRYGRGAVLTVDAITSLATLTGAVDNAIKYGGLTVFAGHSRNLGVAGSLSIANWTALMDYIAAKRDAGLLDCLTPTGAHFAQRGTKVNLLHDSLLLESATGALHGAWQVSGAPTIVAGPDGANAVRTDATNQVWQYPRANNLRTVAFRGRARAASGTATARVVLRSADVVGGVTHANRDIQVAVTDAAWTTVRGQITMDPRATGLRVWLYRAAGSAVDWSDVELVKV